MLTKEDIEDLKLYAEDFNKFCSDNVCGNECEIFNKSINESISCWKAFVDMKKEKTKT